MKPTHLRTASAALDGVAVVVPTALGSTALLYAQVGPGLVAYGVHACLLALVWIHATTAHARRPMLYSSRFFEASAPPYLKRIPGLDAEACRAAFTDASVWDSFDPKTLTLCSPDPQAFRPPEDKVNVLQVRLPTNFKAARFDSDAHTQILRDLERDIDAIRFPVNDGGTDKLIELPVKLKVHESVFVPLAKWSMLLAGNYRCVQKDTVRPIKDAVHSDLEATRSIYNWVVKLCVGLGASEKDMVPFEKYANAALSLGSPSSAARALAAGAPNIERVDLLVKIAGKQKGMQNAVVDETVALVDGWLEKNRKKVA